MSWFKRLLNTLRRSDPHAGISDELREHLEMRIDEYVREGMSREEARDAAERRLGSRTIAVESSREQDILVWLESACRDVRYAVRSLGRNPAFSTTAILLLALGIGANTALFSLIDALLLKTLPVSNPGQLVQVSADFRQGRIDIFGFTFFKLLRERSRSLSYVIAIDHLDIGTVEEHGEEQSAIVQLVSGNYFDVLGIESSRGRLFRSSDALPSAEGVAVLSDPYWRMHYGGSAQAIGSHLRYNKRDFTVVGVAAPEFRGLMLDRHCDIWVPMEQAKALNDDIWWRGAWIEIVGRLRPGEHISQAREELDALYHQEAPVVRKDRRIVLDPAANGISVLRKQYRGPLLILEFIAAGVLLIACANLANLILVRASAREREISTRIAIGAGRAQLIRQLLTESLVIATAGAGLGLLAARWMSIGLLTFLPPGTGFLRRGSRFAIENLTFQMDLRVLAFTAGLTILTCLLFGLLPALRATGVRANSSHNESFRARGSRALMVFEVASSIVLVSGAGLFVRTLQNLKTLDPGFVREHVLTATAIAIATPQSIWDLRTRLAALPSVHSAALSNTGLLSGSAIEENVIARGQPAKPETLYSIELRISPDFFAALGTEMVAGRDFTERDNKTAPKVAIVNESFAREYFGDQNPLGRHFGANYAPDLEIVGLVRDTRYYGFREASPRIFYTPYLQSPGPQVTFVIRSTGDPGALASLVRQIAREIDPKLTLSGMVSLTELVDRTLFIERSVADLSAVFGILALLVASIGLYGSLTYWVARRTREIGVRMALGASRSSVLWMVIRESVAMMAMGAAIGIPLSLALSRLVVKLLYGVRPSDPLTIASATLVLAAFSIAAAYLPALRASRVDPLTALRCD